MFVAIHINKALSHQVGHGEVLRAGFQAHGIQALVTSDIYQPADVHVVSGPHYALNQWRQHDSVLWLDRCYWRGDPEHVSIGWMNKDGSRNFISETGSGRKPPKIKNNANGSGTIFLADYEGPIEQADTVRLHPARKSSDRPLVEDVRRHAVAIGYQTSALVTAALEGLKVVCKDPRNVMYQDNWLDLITYADWSHEEIAKGEAWEHLRL